MGSGGSYGYLAVGSNNSLTFDGATTVTGNFDIYGNTGATIINQGAITHTSTGTSYIYGPSLVNQGTIASNAGSLYVGYYSSQATTNAANGIINASGGNVYLGSPLANNGHINVQSGILYTNNYLTNGTTGVLGGAGTINGGLTMAGGTLTPGNSIGTLTLANGSYSVTGSSTFEVEINGATADRLTFQNPTSPGRPWLRAAGSQRLPAVRPDRRHQLYHHGHRIGW